MSAPRSGRIAPDPNGIKMGPFWLMPEISRVNALTVFYSGFSLIGILTFMGFAQPLVLQEILHVPQDKQGALTGMLGSLQEAIYILLVGFLGALSDKKGRRIIYVAGVMILAVGFFIYPLAGSVPELVAYRILYATGMSAASVMLHTCVAEYSQDASRGKWMGTVGFLNGVGTLVTAFGLTRLPAWFGSMGFSPAEAIRYSLWTVAAYFIGLAVLLRFGLKGPSSLTQRAGQSAFKQLGEGFAAARENPRIALAYAMAFASRGDLAVLISFFSLWLVQTGTDAGMTAAASTAKAGMYFGMAQGVALLWGLSMGFILDRMERMTAMCLAFAMAAIGYFALSQVTDPFGGSMMIPACILVGIGEACAIVAAGVLIGQEAPGRIRGAVMGTFSLVGGTGMLCIVFLGGYMFDLIGRTAPFLMMAVINFMVFIGAVVVRFSKPRQVAV